MVSLYSTSSSPQTFSNLFPNFFQPTAFLFISGLRTPLSVKYIVGLTISRGFNGAIKPSSLPTTNKLRSTVLWNLEQVRAGVVMVEFGARVEGESWCRYGRTPAALKTWKHSSFTSTTQNLSKSKNASESQTSPKCCAVGCQLSLRSDASCHRTRPGSTLVPSQNSPKTRRTIQLPVDIEAEQHCQFL